MSRYLVGIDLGTTNTVLYYVDRELEEPIPELFKITQHVDQGERSECDSLPSFIYLPDENEVPEGSMALPWDENINFTLGEWAKRNAASLPGKVIASTKSWLCADNVDRNAPILPWNRQNPERQLSPLDASKELLSHVKNAWNNEFATDNDELCLEKQLVVLTVPASFDAVARELTVKAAEAAGLKVVLQEEPLAAFYAWLFDMGESWRETLFPGDLVLVCDVGGGTSDFSLIKVIDNDGDLEFERAAVGRHILLGGDNMDLSMAYAVAQKIQNEQGKKLDSYQISGLVHACRQAKETLMDSEDAPPQKLTVLGRGSSLIGGTISTELSREELENILLDGFFPVCDLSDRAEAAKKTGFRSFGLNYESNPAITKHLAEFLSQHVESEASLPNCILFNGGVTKAALIRDRIVSCLQSWSSEESNEIRVITGNDPDKAVAKGGTCYARVREGEGIRIKAGSSRSYYIGVESSMPAVPGFVPPIQGLCVVPFALEEGSEIEIPYSGLGLIVGESSEFRFFASTARKEDEPGMLLEDLDSSEDIDELPLLTATLPVEDNIPPGSLLPVTLRCDLTETGTLQVWCVAENSDSSWKLEFELRNIDD